MDDLQYQPVPYNVEEEIRKNLQDENFRREYEALEPKYALIRELLSARQHSGMTQEAVALKIGTTKSAISRLESGSKHSPSLTTLRKYAKAVNCELEIKLKPKQQPKTI
ncbi:helix-turn-helix domain-containing protein [Pelodictyon phaeoclathratiforme]|jgi:DNA-binding XRE family transcriptional regulator|uniref:Transcriptional regulator, XRE family n=1 Tax=Pelodictyon phaeoclathratiforme (strain DSM 5477 / BU-1) TaxID=324925 RepID=B4SDG3_PELPB|nr:helix-turn-helix transcriptional regulator [Pelodictyon phaeoclathratiforme]ACF42902.1 transcriptional regulator, XRE family [Pelodictyon phaeoclathratiforme BU-1]MBV5289770.1 helix-turn-helix transcriptional regulator [Pelodictyon phaeoclathratiforme]